MARKPFMEMDLEEFEDNDTNDSVINEPSLDFDFDEDINDNSTKDMSSINTDAKNDNETMISLPDDFWYKSENSAKPATDEDIIAAEKELGYKLPKAYKALIKQHNGGRLNRCICPTTHKTSWADDHAEITAIFGIDKNRPSIFETKFYQDDWGYPDIGLAIGSTPTAGHTMVFLDYSKCGRDGEPSVVDIDQEGNYETTILADNFEEFINKLITRDEFEKENTPENTTPSDETPEIPETPDFDNPDDTSTTTQEGYVQEGMFDAGFNNLRSKIAQALGEKFKVTNVVKGMGGKDKFDITEQDVEDPTKTTVESTGTACNVTVRGDGKIGRKIGITLSSALDKILEIVKKPELVLESGFYNISRNVNGGFYQEADDETADDEDFDIDAELDELDSDDGSEEDTTETKDEEEKSSDDDNNDDKDVEEEVDIDIESFGSDTSDVQNEYDQKDVDALNKLIAAESEAINDYFDASKDTRNEDLRTLFSDIGHEERFHLEQLMYSKSILTGEKYEPRDPEVKKEYEELISNGMDEDEAISTAVEKHRIDGGNVDLDEVEQEAAYIYDNLRNSEILTEYCCKAIEQKRVKNALMSAETKFVVEAFIQESLENVSQASKKDVKIKSPIDILIKGLTLSVKGIIRMGEVTRDALHKNNLKNARRKEWIKKHGIVELFRSGVALYFWNDKSNVYDINLACRYVDMLYRLSKDIGAKCGVRLTQDAQRKPIQNPLKYSSIEDGINILRGVVLTKTKIVVNENNKDIIANTFFGYTPDKVGVAVTHGKDGKPVNDSANIYNRVDVALVLTKDYSEVSNAVLGALKRLEGDTNSVFYKNRALFDKSVSQMEFVVKKYQEFVSCLAHDLKVMTKLDNGMLQETRNRDEAEQNGGKK